MPIFFSIVKHFSIARHEGRSSFLSMMENCCRCFELLCHILLKPRPSWKLHNVWSIKTELPTQTWFNSTIYEANFPQAIWLTVQHQKQYKKLNSSPYTNMQSKQMKSSTKIKSSSSKLRQSVKITNQNDDQST